MTTPYPLRRCQTYLAALALLAVTEASTLAMTKEPPASKTGELIMSEKTRPLFPLGKKVFFDEGGTHGGLSAAALVWPVDVPEVDHKANSIIGRVVLLQYVPGGGRKVGSARTFREQTFYVLAGQARFTLGKEKKEVGPGELVFIPNGLSHGYEVVGAAPLKMLMADWRNGDLTAPATYQPLVTSGKAQPLIRLSKESAGTHNGISVSYFVTYYAYPEMAVAPNAQAAWITLQEFDPDPKVVATNVHSHLDQEQAFFMLDGRGLFTLADLKQEAGAGELIYAPRHARHGYEVVGTTPLQFLMMSWKTK